MSFKEYCANMRLLNEEQQHIVMYNRAWCRSYIQALRKGTNVKPYRIFISGPGGTGKTFIVNMIKGDIPYFLKSVVNAGDDQPMVLVTAPTGSAVFQVGGLTIHSASCCMIKQRQNKLGKVHNNAVKTRTPDVVFDR